MIDTPQQDRPLATFALFAYNQEQYIREAIEGAFSQTYEPLEIILSDDCSSDRTSEIMQEMAADYSGPHRVIVRKNVRNEGTARHVEVVFSQSTGALFVIAAGDDISDRKRTTKLVEAWTSLGMPSGLLHSSWVYFNDSIYSAVEKRNAKKVGKKGNLLENYAKGYRFPAAAPTCAYTRDVFNDFSPLHGGSIIEDAPLFLRSALVGSFHSVDEPLVYVRIHQNNSGTGYKFKNPRSWNRFLQSKMVAFRQMQCDLMDWHGDIDDELKKRIEGRILSVIKSASTLAIPESYMLNPVEKIILFFRLLGSESVAFKFRVRVDFALSFFEFEAHTKIKNTLKRIRNTLKRHV